ncbi:hypothetical protein GCM10010430_15290 [Kitasatospora cystarginea]|uniref:Uncharacterized protein n=1 Tax=Kitasatospora cystarginea TaxID=58350 RepID=A0ABN3DLT9_9ACTN
MTVAARSTVHRCGTARTGSRPRVNASADTGDGRSHTHRAADPLLLRPRSPTPPGGKGAHQVPSAVHIAAALVSDGASRRLQPVTTCPAPESGTPDIRVHRPAGANAHLGRVRSVG